MIDSNSAQPRATGTTSDAIATSGVFEEWERIGDVPVPTPGGGQVQVRDIARLVRGYVDPVRRPVYFDGQPAVTLGVSMIASASVGAVLLGIAAQPVLGNLLAGISRKGTPVRQQLV